MPTVLAAATPRSSPSLRATAYHEAAHAVAAYALGRPIKSATIEPKGEAVGHVRFRRVSEAFRLEMQFFGPRARYRVERDLVGSLAGGVAERRLTGRASHVGARFDHAFVADVAFTVAQGNEPEANAYVRWLTLRTERLVEDWWPQIERVAGLLLERVTVTGPEIDAELAKDPEAVGRKGRVAL